MNHRIPFPAAALAAALWLWPAAAYAQGLSARGDLTFSYTDNVEATAADEQDDIYLSLAAGLAYESRHRIGTLTLQAGGNFFLYANEDRLNQLFGDAGIEFVMPLSSRVKLRLADRFIPAPIVLSESEDVRTNLTQANRAEAELIYTTPMAMGWEAELRGTAGRADIIDIDDVFTVEPDYTSLGGGLTLSRSLSRRLTINAESGVMHVLFDTTSPQTLDHTIVSATAGFDYRIGSRLTFGAGGGIGVLLGDAATEPTAIMFTSLGYRPTSRTELTGEFRRSQSTRTDGVAYNANSFSANLSHRLTRRLEASLYTNLTMVDAFNPGIGPADATYLGLGGGLTWDISRRFDASVGYGYSTRFADTPTGEFTRNIISVGLSASF